MGKLPMRILNDYINIIYRNVVFFSNLAIKRENICENIALQFYY